MSREKYDHERLLYRRQFLLGPRFAEGFPTWKRFNVGANLCFTVHPDLPAHQTSNGDMSVVLLGYILDPYATRANDADIIRRLLLHLRSDGRREELIRSSYPLGGRWILIVSDGRAAWLFNDPFGYRQVFYTHTASHELWCGSQPGLLAERLNLSPDKRALDFIRKYRKREPQYWWPGDTSLYKEVRHLLPNHYLNLETGKPHRYWPDCDLATRPMAEVIHENALLLQGLIESASHRFELALGITAGRDTRLLLAASRAIRDRLHLFTMIYWDLDRNSPDIQVPSRLLARLGLPHHVIQCPPRMEREFKQVYRRNVTTARDVYGTIAQGLYNYYPRGRVCMKGNGIEIGKGQYRHDLRANEKDERVSAETLAWLTKREDPFAVEAFDRWLRGMSQTNVDNLDVFRWEEREGNWQAMNQLEWDIVYEILDPYNCRLFLLNMLSVPESHRAGPAYAFHEKMIRHLWPEVLSEPLNPPETQTVVSLARRVIKGARRRVMRATRRLLNGGARFN